MLPWAHPRSQAKQHLNRRFLQDSQSMWPNNGDDGDDDNDNKTKKKKKSLIYALVQICQIRRHYA